MTIHDNNFTISKNTEIAKNIYELELLGNASSITNSGQFVNIKIDGFYLRRPFSICDCDKNKLIIIYKVVGEGTKKLSTLSKQTKLSILLPLGNGFTIPNNMHHPLIIGGGIGIAPLYMLTKKLIDKNLPINLILGFNKKEDIFYYDKFNELTDNIHLLTIDGSVGTRGLPTDILTNLKYDYDYIYTCGPMPMLQSIHKLTTYGGQYSLEERMGCGFGACMGCSYQTKTSIKLLCKDGPVFFKEELSW